MITLRQYQREISSRGLEILKQYSLLYLAMEVRTGKTFTALDIANNFGATNVLFVTKKKAIKGIENDYNAFNPTFKMNIINYEQLHKETNVYDLLIIDEAHCLGAFPKPSKRVKELLKLSKNKPIIYLSGTPTPESWSQIFHQLFISSFSPFCIYKTFYKWAYTFVDIGRVYRAYGVQANDYKNARIEKVKEEIKHIMITHTQAESGFESTVNENILTVKMKQYTYAWCEKLRKDRIIIGKKETILADSPTKLLSKLHQLYSGTVIFESGESSVTDNSKALFVQQKFKDKIIGIFYKFQKEYDMLKEVFGDNITNDLNEFLSEDCNKNIALQIVSGREGISLAKADYLVYINIDFSAQSYWQSRDRLTTINRKNNTVYWIFAENGIEFDIYNVVKNKKKYTTKHFEENERKRLAKKINKATGEQRLLCFEADND
jgi:hypothetical protein